MLDWEDSTNSARPVDDATQVPLDAHRTSDHKHVDSQALTATHSDDGDMDHNRSDHPLLAPRALTKIPSANPFLPRYHGINAVTEE